MSNFNVYVIHSAKPIDELKQILRECGGYTYVGIIYRSSRKKSPLSSRQITEKEETRKTIVFCSPETIQQLEMAYPNYKKCISDYDWSSFPTPNESQGETWHLHISGVPNDYTVSDAENFVTSSLNCILAQKNTEGNSNYTIDFAPRLRETGEIYGFGQLNFDESVPRETVKLCKVILHNTPIGFKTRTNGEKRMVTCVWHRPPQPESRNFQMGMPRRILQRARPSTTTTQSDPQVDVSRLDRNTQLPTLASNH
jgi:hypothetical protein